MTYRTDDEREELIGFIEWLSEHEVLRDSYYRKRGELVAEYMKERQVEREWGKKE